MVDVEMTYSEDKAEVPIRWSPAGRAAIDSEDRFSVERLGNDVVVRIVVGGVETWACIAREDWERITCGMEEK